MRKYIIVVFWTMMPSIAFAQNAPCNNISKHTDVMKGEISYSSPQKMLFEFDMYVTKEIFLKNSNTYDKISDVAPEEIKDEKYSMTFLHILFYKSISNYRAEGVYIMLDDSSIIKDPEKKILCTMTGSSRFLYSSTLSLNKLEDEELEKLKTHNIIKVQLYNYSKPVNKKRGEEIRKYINCLLSKEYE